MLSILREMNKFTYLNAEDVIDNILWAYHRKNPDRARKRRWLFEAIRTYGGLDVGVIRATFLP